MISADIIIAMTDEMLRRLNAMAAEITMIHHDLEHLMMVVYWIFGAVVLLFAVIIASRFRKPEDPKDDDSVHGVNVPATQND